MKTLATTLLTSTVIGFGILEATPSLAASFDFSYTFGTGNVLTGTIDGDVNGDLVENLSNVVATIDGVSVPTDLLDSESNQVDTTGLPPVISFSGAKMDIVVGNNDLSQGFRLDIGTFNEAAFGLGGVTPNFTSETFNASNWTLTPQDTQTTPEPSTILGLLAVGSIGALTRKGKKS
ncbi:MAG: PEP-CTERM sorting domain-containing protein [Microcystaceae cyanobacterium]